MLSTLLETLHPETRLCVATDVTGAAESIRTLTVRAWKALPEDARTLPKLPTVFALLARPSGAPPRYAPDAAGKTSQKTVKTLKTAGSKPKKPFHASKPKTPARGNPKARR